MNALLSILSAIVIVTHTNNLQDSINNANDGDTLLVQAGTYGSIFLQYKHIDIVSQNGPYYTIIDASNTSRAVYMEKSQIKAGEPSLTGFTIINGSAVDGAGVYLKRGGRVEDCFIMYNTASNFGGGVYEVKSEGYGTIVNCIIASNTATSGGGLYMYLGGDVYDSYIYSNTVNNVHLEAHNVYGGVINNLVESPPLNRSTFMNFNMTTTNLSFDFTTIIGQWYMVKYSTNLLSNDQIIYNQYGTGFLEHINLSFTDRVGYYKIYCIRD